VYNWKKWRRKVCHCCIIRKQFRRRCGVPRHNALDKLVEQPNWDMAMSALCTNRTNCARECHTHKRAHGSGSKAQHPPLETDIKIDAAPSQLRCSTQSPAWIHIELQDEQHLLAHDHAAQDICQAPYHFQDLQALNRWKRSLRHDREKGGDAIASHGHDVMCFAASSNV
jgi:hypothetical protein